MSYSVYKQVINTGEDNEFKILWDKKWLHLINSGDCLIDDDDDDDDGNDDDDGQVYSNAVSWYRLECSVVAIEIFFLASFYRSLNV